MKHIRLLNDRIKWLGTGTRRVFGQLVGDVVTVLVDVTASMGRSLDRVKQGLRELLREQLAHTQYFNLVAYSGSAEPFRYEMSEATDENLEAAWEWVQQLQCTAHDSRNVYGAVRAACAELDPRDYGSGRHDVYLFCAGDPDQSPEDLFQFARETMADGSTAIHTIAYNCYDREPACRLLVQLAQITGGRFHMCVDEGTAMDAMHREPVSWAMEPAFFRVREPVVPDWAGDPNDPRGAGYSSERLRSAPTPPVASSLTAHLPAGRADRWPNSCGKRRRRVGIDGAMRRMVPDRRCACAMAMMPSGCGETFGSGSCHWTRLMACCTRCRRRTATLPSSS